MNVRDQTERVVKIGCLIFLCLLVILSTQPVLAQSNTQDGSQPLTVQMTVNSVNKNIPAEAINNLDLRLGGGTYPGCLDVPEIPVVDYKTDNMDLTGVALISTCGWNPNELVTVTLMEPQGKFYTYEVKAVPSKNRKDIYKVDLYFQPGVDAPEGKYRFTIQGQAAREANGTIKTNLFFHRAGGARLYTIPENRFEPVLKALGGYHRLRLDSFLPGEWIRVLIYKFEGTQIIFFAYQDFFADKNGRLVIETNFPQITDDTELNFYAYGQETHSVHLERFSEDGLRVNRQFDLDLFCPGALTSRLTSVNIANIETGLLTFTIYQQPGYGSRVMLRASPDTSMRIYGQPKCIDRAYWWKVFIQDPIQFGWTPESYLGKYVIQPAQ